jgi:hypothetical protein
MPVMGALSHILKSIQLSATTYIGGFDPPTGGF